MKTNQQMIVPIGNYGDIIIGHKTRFGRASDIMSMGNLLREQRGLRPFELKEILRKQDFWEFTVALNADFLSEKESVDSTLWIEPNFELLAGYKNSSGQLQYSKLIKEMPAVIKSQNGGKVENRGVWMELTLLLKLASYLDKVLEVQIYKQFIKSQLLVHQDDSGESFKTLNIAIDKHLPTSAGIGQNRETYIDAAITLRIVCGLPQFIPKGVNVWNTMATDEQLKHRAACLDKVVSFLENDLVRDEEHLLGLIGKMRM